MKRVRHLAGLLAPTLLLIAFLPAACGEEASPTPTLQDAGEDLAANYWELPDSLVADYEIISASGPTVVETKPRSVALVWGTKANTFCTISFGLWTDYGQTSPPRRWLWLRENTKPIIIS